MYKNDFVFLIYPVTSYTRKFSILRLAGCLLTRGSGIPQAVSPSRSERCLRPLPPINTRFSNVIPTSNSSTNSSNHLIASLLITINHRLTLKFQNLQSLQQWQLKREM